MYRSCSAGTRKRKQKGDADLQRERGSHSASKHQNEGMAVGSEAHKHSKGNTSQGESWARGGTGARAEMFQKSF